MRAVVLPCIGALVMASSALAVGPAGERNARGARPDAPRAGHLKVRPANVPDDYVVTPAGFFHPSCVNEIAPDEHIRPDNKIENDRGGARELARCEHPRFDKAGRVVEQMARRDDGVPEPTINGWVESGYAVTSSPLQWISANWYVPTAPYSAGGQVLYYFPGLEDLDNVKTIAQPVLGWYNGQWTLASWNCCIDGNVNQSTPINVYPGDYIYGYAYGTNCTNGACASWSIVSQDQFSNQSTTLNSSGYGQAFDWAFGGVLEAYGITSCQQYPASGSVNFSNIWVQTTGGSWLSPTWTKSVGSLSPSCGYSVDTGSHTVAVSTTNTVPAGVLTPAAPTTCGILYAGQGLKAGQGLYSCDGRFSLQMQLDGNLVLYQGSTALWSSSTWLSSTFSAIMQPDGNFVAYDLGYTAQFSTGTWDHAGAYLALQNDGNLVVYQGSTPLWASNTCCR